MARYQIRTPDDLFLEDVIDRMAQTAWKVIETWKFIDSRQQTSRDFRDFHEAITNCFSRSVRTYKLCGLSNICSDHLQSTEWSPASHVMEANPTDKIYHLFPRSTLESFLVDLTQAGKQAIHPILNMDGENGAESALKIIFQAILSEYLYKDEVCGKTELCVYSSSAPLDIWKEESVSRTSW